MAELLQNTARIDGLFDSIPTWATDLVTVQLADITITKTADPMVWINGDLTFTVTVTNNDPTIPFTDLLLTDVLDPAIIALIENSVAINGVPTGAYTYDDVTGELTVTVPDIAPAESVFVTFRVERA